MKHDPSKNVARAVLSEELGAMERELDALRHQRRFQAAVAALQSFPKWVNPNGNAVAYRWTDELVARRCVALADALLAELAGLKP